LDGPAMPLAISSALRFSCRRTSPVTVKWPTQILSSSLALRLRISQRTLAVRPKPGGSSHGLLLPTAHTRLGGSVNTGLPAPANFRVRGLATLFAVCTLQARAGVISRRQRSWDSPFGAYSSRKVSSRFRLDEPTYRFSCRCFHRRSDRPARQAAVPGL